MKFSPIFLVCGVGGLCYVVDGNSRFYTSLFTRGPIDDIRAWILVEGDQSRVNGDPIPDEISDWKSGTTSLDRIVQRARVRYERNADLILNTLVHFGTLTKDNAEAELRRIRHFV